MNRKPIQLHRNLEVEWLAFIPLSSSPSLPISTLHLSPKLRLLRHCQRIKKLLHQWQLQWQRLRQLG